MKDSQWALIAGSAEGLGKAFTEVLAGQGFNLIMVDKDAELLDKLAGEVSLNFGINVRRLHLDLGEKNAWEACMNEARAVDCSLLVMNAARSVVKPFLDHTTESLDSFVDINTRTTVLLLHAFAQNLREKRKSGNILLMSSMAGLLSPVYVAPYAASKAYLITLGRSLYREFRPYGIGITVCCSGIIDTPKFHESNPRGKVKMEDPARVAAYAVKQCGKKAVCIHGRINRLNYFILSRMLPSAITAYFVNSTMRKIYPIFSR